MNFVFLLFSFGYSKWGNLIFDEEFNTLNFSRWKHEITLSGGGNWEFEYYTNNRTNSYVKNGTLYIKPTLTIDKIGLPELTSSTLDIWGGGLADYCTSNAFYGCSRTGTPSNPINPIQSARINTQESFSFKYGKMEVRAQMPEGDWLWPAIWLLPRHQAYGEWPTSGEIDLIESRGNDHLIDSTGTDIGASQAGTTIHWGPYYGADMFTMTSVPYTLKDGTLFSDNFHTWSLEWTPSGFNVSCDGNYFFNVSTNDGYWKKGNFDKTKPGSFNSWQYGGKDAPFDQEFYIIINLATGGSSGYFPDGSKSQPNGFPPYTQPWSLTSTTAYADFWNSKNNWYPTWKSTQNNGESAALKVDYIKVWEYI